MPILYLNNDLPQLAAPTRELSNGKFEFYSSRQSRIARKREVSNPEQSVVLLSL